MKREHACIALRSGLLAAALATTAITAHALTEGSTIDGRRYLSGGIGVDEVETLRQQAPGFSLQVITAAPSGAYLAGTRVRIVDAQQAPVLDTTTDGPWLLVDLPPGRYTLQATHEGRTVERRLNVGSGGGQRVVLHFDAPVDHGPAVTDERPEPARAPFVPAIR